MPEIQLNRGLVVLIDDEDADLARHRWWASSAGVGKHYYAQRNVPRLQTAAKIRAGKKHLHREIGERVHGAPIPKGYVIDHINGDTMDNRRANLRVVSLTVNTWNQHRASRRSATGAIGVQVRDGKFRAYICTGYRKRHLGTFDTVEEASAARLAAEAERWERAAA
jgi:hypothetical protein